jgi:hypothetical protein
MPTELKQMSRSMVWSTICVSYDDWLAGIDIIITEVRFDYLDRFCCMTKRIGWLKYFVLQSIMYITMIKRFPAIVWDVNT